MHPVHARTRHLVHRLQPALSALAVTVITLAVAACASTPPPTDQLALATAAVAHANAAGAQTLAPAEMDMARDKLRRANLAVTAEDFGRARQLAQQAQVDALLAEAKAEAARARKAADEVQAASRALREEMGRKAP
jgi:Domain of unknown function (DUF4398)